MTNFVFKLKYGIIDYFRKTEVLNKYDKIIKSQFYTSDQLEEIQFQNLKKIIKHAYENVPFYTEVFNKISFHPNDLRKFDDVKRLPLTSKDVVRKNFEKFKASDFQKYLPRLTQTGGTTGKPFVTFRDKLSHSYIWANNFRAWNAGGYNIGDRFIHLASGSLLPNSGSTKIKLYNYLQNAFLITSYHLSIEKIKTIIKLISTKKIFYLYGYSSSVYLIAKYCIDNNKVISSSLKSIFTTSDMLYPEQRTLIEKVFQAKVFDIYGNPESGIISFECPNHNGYHYNQESSFVEVIDVNEALGLGKIISTSLFNYAFPLIRYDTGDVGIISKEKCLCGRNLDKISKLGGRIRDFIKLEDGRFIHGAFFNHLESLYNLKWVERYQIVQESINNIIIKFEINSQPNLGDIKKIENDIRKGLLPSIKIDFEFNGIEVPKSGKFQLIISKLNNNWK